MTNKLEFNPGFRISFVLPMFIGFTATVAIIAASWANTYMKLEQSIENDKELKIAIERHISTVTNELNDLDKRIDKIEFRCDYLEQNYGFSDKDLKFAYL